MVYCRILHRVLCAVLLSIHSMYNSLHTLIPNPLSSAPPLSLTFYLQDITITYQVFLPACLPDSSAGIPYCPNALASNLAIFISALVNLKLDIFSSNPMT